MITRCLTLCALFLFSTPTFVYSEPSTRTVQAAATESITIEATLVKATIAVQVSSLTAREASKGAAEKAVAVLDWLKSAKVNKLKTQGLSLSPQYNYNNGANKIVGYQAIHSISFEVPVAEAGSVLDSVLEKGATRIDYITFSSTDVELEAAKLRSIEKATLSAKAQAEQSLKALGIAPKGVASIVVNAGGEFQPFPMPQPRMLRAAAMEAASPAPPIEGGELQISSSVTVGVDF